MREQQNMSRRLRISLHKTLTVGALALAAAAGARAAGQEKGSASHVHTPVVLMTSQQDHDRQMQAFGISGFPAGPDPYQAATYNEANAMPYPNLPNPLVMSDGTKVTTAAQWTKRRAEIKELFDREVYGRVPRNMPAVKWEVVSSEKGSQPISDVPVITKQLIGHVDTSSYPAIAVNIGRTLVTPANTTGPVPIVMQFGGGGPNPMPPNSTPNPCAPPPGTPPRGAGAGRAAGAGAGVGRGPAGPAGPNWQAQLLQKGWGYAMLNTSSIQADSGCGLTVGIIGLMNKGQPRKMDDWGSLRALAWGADRAMDYFETDKAVDARHVGVEGHSRWGKATLVTMAYDERFAIGYVSSSGEGGAKLHRRKFGELIENLNGTTEYHWMAGNFMKYGGRWNTLPVDSHELIALVAPRPLLLGAGSGPLTSPDGTYQLMAADDPRCQKNRGPCATQPVNIMDAWVTRRARSSPGLVPIPSIACWAKRVSGPRSSRRWKRG